jgi:hypothetical protein
MGFFLKGVGTSDKVESGVHDPKLMPPDRSSLKRRTRLCVCQVQPSKSYGGEHKNRTRPTKRFSFGHSQPLGQSEAGEDTEYE